MNKELEEAIKAIEELRDSYELHLRGWAERCLNTIQTELERLQEENKILKQANTEKTNKIIQLVDWHMKSVPKEKIREKIGELNKNLYTVEHYETIGAIKVLKELLEEK